MRSFAWHQVVICRKVHKISDLRYYGRQHTHSEEEYTVGIGDMEDLFILLINPAMSCPNIFITRWGVFG